MLRKITVSLGLALMMCLLASVAYAQDGILPTPTNTPRESSSSDVRGTVRGYVFVDVNGDGNCVNTGIAGEEPAAGISVEFVSSDEQQVITHTSGEKGDYELAAAGASNWRVTAKPGSEWVVTSENPQYALVSKDHLAATDVNFCVSKGGVMGVTGVTAVYPMIPPVVSVENTVLPEAGAAAATPTTTLLPLLLGLSLIALGLVWRWYEKTR
ncbi:MAG: hypothetical protein IAF02_13320 [Anaerolineae bacterium]|nr:hypothetical protein [Anaerolineae bacterium]